MNIQEAQETAPSPVEADVWQLEQLLVSIMLQHSRNDIKQALVSFGGVETLSAFIDWLTETEVH